MLGFVGLSGESGYKNILDRRISNILHQYPCARRSVDFATHSRFFAGNYRQQFEREPRTAKAIVSVQYLGARLEERPEGWGWVHDATPPDSLLLLLVLNLTYTHVDQLSNSFQRKSSDQRRSVSPKRRSRLRWIFILWNPRN